MKIKQWEDKFLSHFSYGVLSEQDKTIMLVDPARNPAPYLEWAEQEAAKIIGVIETHPHADFISSHAEIARATGAIIYTSEKTGASYPHQGMSEGSIIQMGEVTLTALDTPGHSPDSICIVAAEDGIQKAVFTGDTLFIGDCGRPDLREGAGSVHMSRKELAGKMYHSLRDKLMPLPGDVKVFPAHGSGSLCGKALSDANSSTMAAEKMTNWSLQDQAEDDFIQELLNDQPFVPAYFPYDVELNRKGADNFEENVSKVKIAPAPPPVLDGAAWIIDTRDEKEYKKNHLAHTINLMDGTKFETWLGSIIRPGEGFYLTGNSESVLRKLVARAASIGYETKIKAAFVFSQGTESMGQLDLDAFGNLPEAYNIIDVRNKPEVKEEKIFTGSISIPLAELRERLNEIPLDKPLVVHCAGGYRSAAASSLIQSALGTKVAVFDLGEAVKDFMPQAQ